MLRLVLSQIGQRRRRGGATSRTLIMNENVCELQLYNIRAYMLPCYTHTHYLHTVQGTTTVYNIIYRRIYEANNLTCVTIVKIL